MSDIILLRHSTRHSFTWRVFPETLFDHIHHGAGRTPTSSVSRSNHAWDVFDLPALFYGQLDRVRQHSMGYSDYSRSVKFIWFDVFQMKLWVTWQARKLLAQITEHVCHLVEALHLSKSLKLWHHLLQLNKAAAIDTLSVDAPASHHLQKRNVPINHCNIFPFASFYP